MTHVFVSYSRKDSDFVLRLVSDLKKFHVSVWLDQLNIQSGQRWDKAIEDALDNASHVVLILSPYSAESENVRDEIDLALDNGKEVIPILLQECKKPLRVRRQNHIDFREDYNGALEELLKKLPKNPPGSIPVDMNKLLEDKEILTTEAETVGTPHILIVEDTVELAEIIQAKLEGLGFRTFYETHAASALSFLKANKPILILLDIGLPDISGWSLLDKIKDLFQSELPPIVIITAYGDPANRLVAKLGGVTSYLVKPFTPDEVERVVMEILRKE